MTTIAYRAGILAADSAWNDADTVETLAPKLVRLRSGALLGMAGHFDSRLFVPLLNAVKKFEQVPSYDDLAKIRMGFSGLLVLPDETIVRLVTTDLGPEHWSDHDARSGEVGAWQITEAFAAIGSGADAAWGAMAAGASARQAVRIACRRDRNSRPPVNTLYLGGKK